LIVFVGESIVWEIFRVFVRQFGNVSYQLEMEPTFEEAIAYVRRFQADSDSPPTASARWN
jgi:hypothetical protein